MWSYKLQGLPVYVSCELYCEYKYILNTIYIKKDIYYVNLQFLFLDVMCMHYNFVHNRLLYAIYNYIDSQGFGLKTICQQNVCV